MWDPGSVRLGKSGRPVPLGAPRHPASCLREDWPACRDSFLWVSSGSRTGAVSGIQGGSPVPHQSTGDWAGHGAKGPPGTGKTADRGVCGGLIGGAGAAPGTDSHTEPRQGAASRFSNPATRLAVCVLQAASPPRPGGSLGSPVPSPRADTVTFQRRAGWGPKGEARRGGQSLTGLSAFHSLLIFLPLSPRPLGSLCLTPSSCLLFSGESRCLIDPGEFRGGRTALRLLRS